MSGRAREPYLLHDWLRRSADLRPDAPAVRADGVELSYGELDGGADRVAATLAELGVRPGDRVGLSLPKSVEAVASIYGILRAGAAYVPIDPRSPRPARPASPATASSPPSSRTSSASRNCGRSTPARPSPASPARRWPRTASWRGRRCRTDRRLLPPFAASTPTSPTSCTPPGRRGRPKGVVLSHRNALTFVRLGGRRAGRCGPTTVLQPRAAALRPVDPRSVRRGRERRDDVGWCRRRRRASPRSWPTGSSASGSASGTRCRPR